jgi:hypothetical protein
VLAMPRIWLFVLAIIIHNILQPARIEHVAYEIVMTETQGRKLIERILVASALLVGMTNLAPAADVVTTKNIGMELARDIASEAIKVCRGMGYQVSAVAVDRGANLRAALRDDLATRLLWISRTGRPTCRLWPAWTQGRSAKPGTTSGWISIRSQD